MIAPFRFWCNKILPLVYDDSLSYYELLCKVVDYLNKVIAQTNESVEYINTLGKMLEDYLSSPEIREIIEHKLDEMAEDGTLDAIINQPKMFVPTDDDINNYKKASLKRIASWIYYLKDSACKVLNLGEAEPVNAYRAIYDKTGKSWAGLLGKDALYPNPGFVYDDTDNGTPIVYTSCSSFVGIVERARGYLESPNFLALSGQATTDAEIRNTCLELGNAFQYSWTIDFLNFLHAPHMFYILEKSGCTPWAFNKDGVYIDKVFDNMETGDIIFCARNDNNYYKQIHHVAYYIKDLADLNRCEHNYPCTFKAYDFSEHDDYPDTNKYGYVAHCSWGVTSHSYSETANDVIRIESVDHMISQDIGNPNHVGPFTYYVAKPYSNTLNSSKARRVFSNTINDANNLMFGRRNTETFPTRNVFKSSTDSHYYGEWILNYLETISGAGFSGDVDFNEDVDFNAFINAKNINLQGQPLLGTGVSSADLNAAGNGVWSWGKNSVENISNLPANFGTHGALLFQYGRDVYYWWVQLLFADNGGAYFRVCWESSGSARWGEWYKISVTSPQDNSNDEEPLT